MRALHNFGKTSRSSPPIGRPVVLRCECPHNPSSLWRWNEFTHVTWFLDVFVCSCNSMSKSTDNLGFMFTHVFKGIHNSNEKVLWFSSFLIIHSILSLISCMFSVHIVFWLNHVSKTPWNLFICNLSIYAQEFNGLSTFGFETGLMSCPPCFPCCNPFCLHQHARLGCPPIG